MSETFERIKDAIENSFFPEKKCCSGIRTAVKNYGPHLFIETHLGEDVVTPLYTIPLELNLSQKYILAGVICYSGTFKKNSIGHYTAYIKMLEHWSEFDDMAKERSFRSVNNDTRVHAHLRIYYTV